MKRVLIIEAQIKNYRRPFYDGLHAALREDGIQLRTVYSDPNSVEQLRNDRCDLPVEYGVKVKGHWFANESFLFQPALREIIAADLVVLDQANKFIMNHLLLPLSLCKFKKVAFWGIGAHWQKDRSWISEAYKRLTLDWVDWWFAYTQGSANYLEKCGVARTKITAVQNSIDTQLIHKCVLSMDGYERELLRASFDISPNAFVGIFVGALHKTKSIPFLMEAARQVRRDVPDFHLLVIGDGPHAEGIRKSAAEEAWIHFIGPKFGAEKSRLLAISDVFLLPGLVGLAILDAFAANLPLLTTRLEGHGPEIEYLAEGQNGIITTHCVNKFAETVMELYQNPALLKKLRDGARRSAQNFSIEAMIQNFRGGLRGALASPRWNWSSLDSWKERGLR